LIKTV